MSAASSPSAAAGSGGMAANASASPGSALPTRQIFEQLVMMWYSSVMFVSSGLLFLITLASSRLSRDAIPRYVHLLDVLSWTALYFALSVTLVVYNKWLISVWEGGFRFPMTMTLVHMIIKFVLSWTIVRGCRSHSELPRITKQTYIFNALPVGITTALDVALSNASLFYISISMYTVIKSSSLVFVLLFSVLYRLQPCKLELMGVTAVICLGVLMASYGDANLDLFGFFLVLFASVLGGYRWALTEVLMQKIGLRMNALMTIYTISPASVAGLLPFCLFFEGRALILSKFYSNANLFALAILNVCGSGLFAFGMIYVELALLQRTSSLTLGVIGYLKQVIQIVLSVIIFDDILSPLNVTGIVVTMLGFAWYVWLQARPKPGEGAAHLQMEPVRASTTATTTQEERVELARV